MAVHGIFNKQNWAHILTLAACGSSNKNAKNVQHLTPHATVAGAATAAA